MIYRYVAEEFRGWAASDNPKCLIVRGARQVGKTTALLDFPSYFPEKQVFLYINLEEHRNLEPIFAAMKVSEIFSELSYRSGISLESEGIIVFLDEIQAVPSAFGAMRYLREHRPDVRFAAAGSLLEIAMAKKNISVPVGRMDYNFMGTVSIEEYLNADPASKEEIKCMKEWIPGDYFPEAVHRNLSDKLREYLVIGGMPEAVQSFLSHRDMSKVSRVHSSILNTYRDDFAKYSSGDELLMLQRVFDWVPARAGDKVIYSNISADAKAIKVRKAIELLSGAGVIYPVVHSAGNGVPLNAESRESVFKLYFLDVGLMSSLTGITRISAEKILSPDFVNSSRLAEQFIAQHLFFRNPSREKPSLNYWLRHGRNANAEIDFLIQEKEHVIPIEVKAGSSGRMKSLIRFLYEKNSSFAIRFDMNPPSLQRVEHKLGNGLTKSERISFDLLSLPLYMVGEISRLEEEIKCESNHETD